MVTISLRLPRAGVRRLDASARTDGAKTQILEFRIHAVDAQPLGNGGIDFQGFLGNAAAFFGVKGTQSPHVVQAVGQLDQNDANVTGHGHGHFLEVFCLGFGLGDKLHLCQLADTIDHLGHTFAELCGQCLFGNAGILDHVVQHGGHQALVVHVHFGKDGGNRQRVGNVMVTTAAQLAIVSLFGVIVGPPDQVDLIRAKVVSQLSG